MSALIVNLFGAPGAGKSTGAAYVFSKLKLAGINAELITEFAKDKTWEKNDIALAAQDYIFAKQHYRIRRCVNDVDVIVTDSPLLLSIIYNTDPVLGSCFSDTVKSVFNSYDNANFFITRAKEYQQSGRSQSEQESDELAADILYLLERESYPYEMVLGNTIGYDIIVSHVLRRIHSKKTNCSTVHYKERRDGHRLPND